MEFQPKTEAQLIEENLSPEGEYDFEVTHAEEKQSAKGNDMIELTVKMFIGDKTRTISDYLLEAMQFKMLHFCEATGLTDKYYAGSLTAFDCIGCVGKLQLAIQPAKGDYGPKNSIKDYIVSDAPIRPRAPISQGFDNDEIPY